MSMSKILTSLTENVSISEPKLKIFNKNYQYLPEINIIELGIKANYNNNHVKRDIRKV
jgi:hypothetical protein